jgi:hypothetical protein
MNLSSKYDEKCVEFRSKCKEHEPRKTPVYPGHRAKGNAKKMMNKNTLRIRDNTSWITRDPYGIDY